MQQELINNTPNLSILSAAAEDLSVDTDDHVNGLVLGVILFLSSFVVTFFFS